ncbi:hypothetical protein VitviT2T_015768 [Vitis vinifera]|uniref:Transmembrane protein n=1 Tax=Vitis vinifera TaxID=29760 RepID=A0ABY9CNM3_VITVI|nr:hypothetical protein VitviT2T_015768 [Vitis vinifera]
MVRNTAVCLQSPSPWQPPTFREFVAAPSSPVESPICGPAFFTCVPTRSTPTFLKINFSQIKSESHRSSGNAREKCGSTVVCVYVSVSVYLFSTIRLSFVKHLLAFVYPHFLLFSSFLSLLCFLALLLFLTAF